MPEELLPEDICSGGVFAIRNTLNKVKWFLKNQPERALATTYSPKREKEALFVDEDAECHFLVNLTNDYNAGLLHEIEVWGEESITRKDDFTGRAGIFALADMIDGTDLLERNLSNWCSPAVFFRPRNEEGHRIVAACVGVPSGKIYYAHADSPDAFYKLPSTQTCKVRGRSSIKKLSEASICFYGQKASRLKHVTALPLLDYLIEQPEQKNANVKKCRIYALAGIPMMMKLIDHQVADAANIDLVFESVGQHPHDVVAGAYIARKEGAFILNLDTGKVMSDVELERGLLRPGHSESELRYVIASTPDLCFEIAPLLEKKKAAVARI